MKTVKALKKISLISIFTLTGGLLCAQTTMKSMYIEYIKGDVSHKTALVKRAGSAGDSSLPIEALGYCMDVYSVTGDDPEMTELAVAAVEALGKFSSSPDAQEISSLLGKAFTTFSDSKLRIALLKSLASYPSSGNVSIINAYLSEKIQSASPMDEVLENAISALRSIGNRTSFNLLFVADIMNLWPEKSELLEYSFGPLANSSGKEILNILTNVPMEQKLEILNIVTRNKEISENIKGEVAENALSQSIYSVGDTIEISPVQIDLQLFSLDVIAGTKWTRASKLAGEYFSIAQSEYEHDSITTEEFTRVISNVAKVATSDTGRQLSLYLEELNKRMEQGTEPEESVVLAVINALGGLGDKTAFDYLLYVTYLDYPSSVTQAARNALAKLKW